MRFELFANKYPNKEICQLLIDQSFVCGIGNYLRSDILYLSKIYPYKKLHG